MKYPLIVLLFTLPVVSAVAGPRAGAASVSREGPRGGSVEAEGAHVGRFGAGSVSAEGANGGTYDASGVRAGRFGAGTASATGPNGGTYDASAARAGRYGTANVNAQGANGGTYDASATRAPGYSTATVNAQGANGGTVNTTYNGYRSGYVYTGGVYKPASVTVNSVYVAPVGAYAGWSVMAKPVYVSYPAYATYPVEVSVQVELQREGYYAGTIDGTVGPGTQQAIAKYQAANGLPVTGTINQALLNSMGISGNA